MDQIMLDYIERSVSVFNNHEKGLQNCPDLTLFREKTLQVAGIGSPASRDVTKIIFDFEDDAAVITMVSHKEPQFPYWKIIKPAHIQNKKTEILASFGYEFIEFSDIQGVVEHLINKISLEKNKNV